MQNIYSKQGQQIVDIIKETTQVSLNYSVNILEEQMEIINQGLNRQMSRIADLQQLNTPESVLDFQKKVSADELAELQKLGEAYYNLSENANREFISVAKKGQELAETVFGEAVKQSSTIFPNGKSKLFSDAIQNTTKTINEAYQNSFDAAAQAIQAGAKTAIKSQQVVAQAKNGKAAGKTAK